MSDIKEMNIKGVLKIGFTKGFLWAMNKGGDLYQVKLEDI